VITRRIKVLNERSLDAHKYSHGTVAVIAGSDQYPGAAVLTVGGARRGGAGYIQYLDLNERPTDLVLQTYPDVIKRGLKNLEADAWVIGSGAPELPRRFTMPSSSYLVLDAASILLVRDTRSVFTVITPHEGEFKALGYAVTRSEDRVMLAKQAAQDLNVYVLLKGPRTVIASPIGKVVEVRAGGPELATAGTGDVLAGFLASMLASWKPSSENEMLEVLEKAVRAHGLAGKRAEKNYPPMTALDLLNELPKVIS
jgi:hydroxyethylthiazole kinase-like uncharacterized protein yjeF